MLAGQVIAGACVSFTVTVNEHAEVLGGVAVSLTVQVTVVTPFANVVPDAGVQIGVATPGQLSVAVGFVKVTTALQRFGSVGFVMFAGHPTRVGGCASFTVTVNEQVTRGEPTDAVQVTLVTPLLKVLPDGGTQVTDPHDPTTVGAE